MTMTITIKVPMLPESVSDATVAKIYKQVGDAVELDENLIDLETDKVMLEVVAETAGVITAIEVTEADIVTNDTVLLKIDELAKGRSAAVKEVASNIKSTNTTKEVNDLANTVTTTIADELPESAYPTQLNMTPVVRRLIAEHGLDAARIPGTGKDGRITKEDVTQYIANPKSRPQPAVEKTVKKSDVSSKTAAVAVTAVSSAAGPREERRVAMSRLRSRVAERLLQVQQQAAILTTFNEVDMQPVMNLRKQYKDSFEKQHGVRLGFMSFFVKAVVEALQRFPIVNATLDESDIVYHNYCDIGVAVASPRGLVVPIIRNAEQLSMAQVEQTIGEFAVKAKDAKLTMEDMTGGTFTVTNGGVFGSMLSTPIINPPQSAILGMHNIVERPVVKDGEVVVRPVMYIALSYDHRLIDGSDAVRFLVTIKNMLEDPTRLLLQV